MAIQTKDDKDNWIRLVEHFFDFYDNLAKETERGSVIVAAALIDDGLRLMIAARLVPPQKEDKDELFINHGPLSTFSGKIDFAYRLGLIGSSLRSSLHLLRKNRNDFAHSHSSLSFKSQEVHDRIRGLFKLNRPLFNVVWSLIREKSKSDDSQDRSQSNPENGLDYFIDAVGWKSTFEILSAIIAASLLTFSEDVTPLIGKDAKVNGT